MRWFAALGALAGALICASCSDPYEASSASTQPTAAIPRASLGEVPQFKIQAQDRVARSHRVREERAMVARPLLDRLPLQVGRVRIEIAGLDPDGRTVVLGVRTGGNGRAHALAVYRDVLVAYGDSGAAYRTEVIEP